MRAHPVLLALIGLAPSTACVRETDRELTLPSAPEEDAPWNPAGQSREVLIADEPAQADGDADPAGPVAPRVSAQPPIMQPEPILFRLGAGYGVLGRLDLSTCREQGLQPGYLHVRVTFRRSGHIVRAAVESPVAPPQEALDCIGEQLEWAMVPVFDGGDVTLSKSFFVN